MENTLNIQITLDDNQLKDLIVGNINDLPKEKLQEVLLAAIKEILTSQRGQELFITKDSYYGSSYKPSAFLTSLVQKADITEVISPGINEVVAQFINNYDELMQQCMREVISGMFFDVFSKHQLSEVWNNFTQRRE
jgi:hypothetical protein